ncbi:MAG: hypothetical protein H0V01_04660 [Bacteroidetes bacterium]|nr:hypothetical protein [Bacteroidota bacterium]HET6244853.1 hypothetical protein [Bacteroidia bacterium]
MKKILFVVFLFPFCLFGQNWQMFPKDQTSYFIENDGKTLHSTIMDSVEIDGNQEIFYFRRNINLQGAGNCYQDIFEDINKDIKRLCYFLLRLFKL